MAALCYDPLGQGERYQMIDLTRSGRGSTMLRMSP